MRVQTPGFPLINAITRVIKVPSDRSDWGLERHGHQAAHISAIDNLGKMAKIAECHVTDDHYDYQAPTTSQVTSHTAVVCWRVYRDQTLVIGQ